MVNKLNQKNTDSDPNIPVTIILSYIYSKIKKRNKGPIIKIKLLKEIIRRHFIISKGEGGARKGLENIYLYDIIEDMINFKLIKRIDYKTYEILPIKSESSLLSSLDKKVKYLKNLRNKNIKDIPHKTIIKINNYLTELLDVIDNSEYLIIDNNSEKRLRHFPF
jgi:hypothetical protein